MKDSATFISLSPLETQEIGSIVAKLIQPGDVVCLTGDLGAGKTTLMKGLAHEISSIDPNEVTSPTFTYLHIYSGPQTLYHFDLYRLEGEADFISHGFTEFIHANSICCVEWPERLPSSIDCQKVLINISYKNQEQREITFRRL